MRRGDRPGPRRGVRPQPHRLVPQAFHADRRGPGCGRGLRVLHRPVRRAVQRLHRAQPRLGDRPARCPRLAEGARRPVQCLGRREACDRRGGRADGFGLDPDPDPDPGMALHPLPPVPRPAAGIRIARVDEASLAEHARMRLADGMPPDVVAALFSSEFLADPDVEMFTAFLDGDPVGGSVAIRSGDVAGVYAVGTLEAARRRGVASAATWACVKSRRGLGLRHRRPPVVRDGTRRLSGDGLRDRRRLREIPAATREGDRA